jgi:hypothetical protein
MSDNLKVKPIQTPSAQSLVGETPSSPPAERARTARKGQAPLDMPTSPNALGSADLRGRSAQLKASSDRFSTPAASSSSKPAVRAPRRSGLPPAVAAPDTLETASSTSPSTLQAARDYTIGETPETKGYVFKGVDETGKIDQTATALIKGKKGLGASLVEAARSGNTGVKKAASTLSPQMAAFMKKASAEFNQTLLPFFNSTNGKPSLAQQSVALGQSVAKITKDVGKRIPELSAAIGIAASTGNFIPLIIAGVKTATDKELQSDIKASFQQFETLKDNIKDTYPKIPATPAA